MKQYAEKENIMAQPRRVIISSFFLTNGTIITPLLLFYLKLGLVCIKIQQFVQYTPIKCFDNFVHAAVDARRQGYENPNSSVAAKTMRLLVNGSYGYQIMDRSRHTVIQYLTDEKTHSALNSKVFKRLITKLTKCMRWNLSSQKWSIENQSLWDSLSYNTQH